MEQALEWLDEAIYLGKKVLVHCRMGIGRTGTFITSYLLRRGFGLKMAQKKLKKIRSSPSSFAQWRLLRKYGKREGKLTIREPTLEGTRLVDLSLYFSEYDALLKEADEAFAKVALILPNLRQCGRDADACCSRFFYLQLVEAAYLNYYLNKNLTREDRLAAIRRAISGGRTVKGSNTLPSDGLVSPSTFSQNHAEKLVSGENNGYTCPLNEDGKCIAFPFQPLICRVYGIPTVYRGEVLFLDKDRNIMMNPLNLFSLDMVF